MPDELNQALGGETPTAPDAPDTSTALCAAGSHGASLSMWSDTKAMNAAWRTAKMLATCDLLPQAYQGRPENILIALDAAVRLNMSPMLVAQNLYVVQGKPAWSGSFCAAAINGSGKFTPLEYIFVGQEGEPSFGCMARATRLSTGAVCTGDTITLQMAKDEGWLDKKGSKWKTMPRQMMMYRAASFFARAFCPEVLLGFQTAEEVQDVRGYDTAPQTTTVVLEGEVIDRAGQTP